MCNTSFWFIIVVRIPIIRFYLHLIFRKSLMSPPPPINLKYVILYSVKSIKSSVEFKKLRFYTLIHDRKQSLRDKLDFLENEKSFYRSY